jgi:hypothetical protein
MKDFFYSDRVKDKKNPLPLLSDLEKMKGIPQLRVSYAELGISTNNYAQSIIELDKITDLKVPKFSIKNGRFTTEKFWVFTKTESVMGDNFATLKINMDVVDEIFNMAEGYVTHPDDIALLAKVEKMPVLYFLLKRKMRNWKINAAKFNYNELKEALGLITKDIYGTVISEKYERFAAFKKRVIEASLKDLDRLVAKNKIDKSFTVEYDYNGHKPVGEPMYIIFRTKEKPKEEPKAIELKDEPKAATKEKKPKAQQTELQFTDEEPQYFTPYKERAPYIPEYEETQRATPSQKAQEYESNFITEYKRNVENEKKRWQDKWDSFVGHYNGRGKEILAQIKCNGISSVSCRNISVSYPDKVKKELDKLKLTNEEWEEIVSQLNKHKFVAYGILGIDRIAQGKNPAVLWSRK